MNELDLLPKEVRDLVQCQIRWMGSVAKPKVVSIDVSDDFCAVTIWCEGYLIMTHTTAWRRGDKWEVIENHIGIDTIADVFAELPDVERNVQLMAQERRKRKCACASESAS